MTAAEYLRLPAVRDRIREFCGSNGPDDPPSCAFISRLPRTPYPTWEDAVRSSPVDLPRVLDLGMDVARSLWDYRWLLVHLDLDYMNPAAPADVFLRPLHAYERLEPLAAVVRRELAALDLPLRWTMTGRGYHVSGVVPLASPIVDRLAAAGRMAATRALDDRLAPGRWQIRPPAAHDEAALGLGLVLESLAHRVLRRAGWDAIPVVLDNVEVGVAGEGREAASFDLSYLGDPLETRQVRVDFGTYQTPRTRPDMFGAASALPPFAAVPCGDRPFEWLLEHARPLEEAARLAEGARSVLPDVSAGVARLLDAYEGSPVAAFHRDYYAVPIPAPESWTATYDAFDPHTLPPCVAEPLECPNDRLLRPAVLQHVARALLAAGWHPRHVAGLVLAKYARDQGWGSRWRRLDPARRADFDVRVFAGLVLTGLDRGVDFNCVSAQEKGLCPLSGCRHDLRTDRDRLLERTPA